MRLILGLPPPHRPHFPSSVSTPHRSPPPFPFPRLFPCLPSRRSLYRSQPGLRLRSRFRSGSRTCFRVRPALVSVPVSASVPAWSSPPFPFPLRFPHLFSCLPRAGLCPSLCLGFRLRSRSRACFRACPAPVPVSTSAPVSVPVPVLVPAPASIPASVSVPAPVSAPRRSLSQSLPRSPTRFCLSCSSFRSFQLPGTQSRLPQ